MKISLEFVPKGLINNSPALVQIMAWRLLGDKPLSEPMMVSLLTHLCVTQPQWVNNDTCHFHKEFRAYLIKFALSFLYCVLLWLSYSSVQSVLSRCIHDIITWSRDVTLKNRGKVGRSKICNQFPELKWTYSTFNNVKQNLVKFAVNYKFLSVKCICKWW